MPSLAEVAWGSSIVPKTRSSAAPVALKILSAELTADPDRRRRFLQEARSAARITHPAIAQVYDVDEEDGVTFIAMELVEGRTVRSMIGDRDLDLLSAIDIASQVAGGLAKAHEAGIVHRDVKSDNVIMTPDGHAKILDFGLAKLLDPGAGQSEETTEISALETLAQTQMGVVMGTVAYMSPEQARGRDIDHRTDIFSLGVMLYEMATGELPFKGANPLDTMHAIAFEESRPVNSVKENLPYDLQRIVSKCLRKRAPDRFPDALALQKDLRQLQRDAESGRMRAATWKDRIGESIETLRSLRPADYVWYAGGAGLLIVISYLLLSDFSIGTLVVLGLIGLFVYRNLRNRPERLLRRFVSKTSKLPAVRLILFQEGLATVLIDQAQASLYQKINQHMRDCNRKLFFGDPLKVAIREEIASEELQKLLIEPGVEYVRDDVLMDRLPPNPE